MANEISVTMGLSCTNGNFSFPLAQVSSRFDQAASGGGNPGTVSVGTSEETIALGDIGTAGWAQFQNIDATNYVEWGFSTGVYGGRMEPGEPAQFRINPGATIYMRANTATCKVRVNVLED